MWDFTCPTFQKFEIFGQVECRTCDNDPCKWLYRHLKMYRKIFIQEFLKLENQNDLKLRTKANMKQIFAQK